MAPHPVQDDSRKEIGGDPVGRVGDAQSEKPMEHRKMCWEGHETEDDKAGIAAAERSSLLPQGHVVAQQSKRGNAEHLSGREGQLVTLELGMQHEALEVGVTFVAF